MLVRNAERFVGRADALAELGEAYASALRGHPRLVLVTGDAGIGKSTLVEHFAAGQAEVRVLRGGCFGLVSAELPYSPIVQALRPLSEDDDIDDSVSSVDGATLCSALGGSATAVGEATRWAQSRLFESTLRLLRDLSRQKPLVLVLEDLHWADQATLDLLLFVLGNLVNERILLLLTSRADEPDSPPWLEEGLQRLTRSERSDVLELGPLRADEAEQLVASLADEDPDRDAVRTLVERAQGNPLFLTELARARARTQQALPRRLRDLLLLRLTRLSRDALRVVDLLSAATSPLDTRHLLSALGDHVADARAAVAEAYDARLVTTDDADRLQLRHALLADAVYTALPPTDRAHLHACLASAIGADDDAGALTAYHWERAGRPECVPLPLARAARNAMACFAFADAARAWERLLDLWQREPDACAATGLDRVEVLVQLARAHRWGATPERAVRALEQAVDLVEDSVRAASVHEQLARQLTDLGRVEEALSVVEQAARHVPDAPPEVQARVAATAALALMFHGDYLESRQRCEAALRLTEGREDSWERAHALTVLGVDLVNVGNGDAAVAAIEQATRIARRMADPEPILRNYINQSYVLEAVGRNSDAVRSTDEGLAYAERQDMFVVAGTVLLGNKASALIGSGELLQAREVLRRALSLPGVKSSLVYARLRLAEVDVALGRLDEAERALAELSEEDLGSSSLTGTQTRLVRALLALARSRPDEAQRCAREELERERGGTEPVVGLHLYAVGLRGVATAAAGRSDDAGASAQQAEDLLAAARALRDQAPLSPCQDLYDLCVLEYRDCLGQVDADAWAGLARRLTGAGRAGLAPYLFLRAATAALAASGRSAAEGPLREAWRLLQPLGDTPLGREATALAKSCRVDLGASAVPRQRTTSPLGLTPRETQVLELVCAGATNRQIARSLTISERTAGVHVSNILAKLHARNRAEAIAIAHRSGAVAASS